MLQFSSRLSPQISINWEGKWNKQRITKWNETNDAIEENVAWKFNIN